VVVSGFTQAPAPVATAMAGLTVSACAGAVRIQDCAWMGEASAHARGGAGVRIENSGDGIVINGNANGGAGGEDLGRPGARSSSRRPTAADTRSNRSRRSAQLWGGNATAGLPATSTTVYNLTGAEGGSGAYLDGSFFFASGTLLKGGKGGKHQLSPSNCVQANGAGACGNRGRRIALRARDLERVGAAAQHRRRHAGHVDLRRLLLGGATWCAHRQPLGGFELDARPRASRARSRRLRSFPGTTVVNLTATGAPGDLLYAVVESAPHFQFDAAAQRCVEPVLSAAARPDSRRRDPRIRQRHLPDHVAGRARHAGRAGRFSCSSTCSTRTRPRS
jgi:hypothetical protein